jgi:hypothetical protein
MMSGFIVMPDMDTFDVVADHIIAVRQVDADEGGVKCIQSEWLIVDGGEICLRTRALSILFRFHSSVD